MRVKFALALACALLAQLSVGCSKPRSAEAERKLVFLRRGSQVSELSLSIASEGKKLERVRVFEPYEQREVEFQAFPLIDFLDRIYGESWREEEQIIFNCSDGYKSAIPVGRVLSHRAWLAINRSGDQGFAITKFEEGKKRNIFLSPAYLVWDNLRDKNLREESDYGWPYQIISVDLNSTRSQFSRMIPPGDSSDDVQQGFTAFVVNCTPCHAINGEGGLIGPELNYPANPTEYLRPEWLAKRISDPASVRFATRMTPLNPSLPNRDQVIRNLIAYLSEMAKHKKRPDAATP